MHPSATRAGLSLARLARVTEHLRSQYVEPKKIAGCQVLVARHGEVAHFESLGLADAERGTPVREDTIWRIYSMTKPITSIALMQLYERGMFQLNDPVARVLPELRDQRVWVSGEGASMVTEPQARPMTFRHLLTHTAGFTYGGGLNFTGEPVHPVDAVYQQNKVARGSGDDLDAFIAKLGTVPLRFQPGAHFHYSFATDVCGALVQRLSGMRLDDYFRQHIFGPLGMVDTDFSIAPEKVHRFASNYTRGTDKGLKIFDDGQASTYAKPPAFLSGGGGLLSTTADYLRFCEMLRRGGELDGARIIGPRTLRLMTQNHLPGNRDLTQIALGSFSETANEGVGFGLGFATTLGEVAAGGLGPGDFYWGGLASTIFWVDPREDLVVIFMTQLVPSGTFNFRGQLKNIVYSSIVD